jgi:hypothetical protein
MVTFIGQRVDDSKHAKITEKQIAAASPDKLCTVVHKIRHSRNDKYRNLSRLQQRALQRCQQRLKHNSHVLPDPDKPNLENALDILEPLIRKKYKDDEKASAFITHSIHMLKFPIGSQAARFPKILWDEMMYLAAQSKESVYNFLKVRYHFPDYKYAKQVLWKLYEEPDSGDGPCYRSIARNAMEVGASAASRVHVILSFDSVKASADGFIMSNRKEEHGRILCMPTPTAETDVGAIFKRSAHEFYDEAEKEIQTKLYGRKETEVDFEEMMGAMESITDVSVYYATYLCADINKETPLKRSFICGRYSTSSIGGDNIVHR